MEMFRRYRKIPGKPNKYTMCMVFQTVPVPQASQAAQVPQVPHTPCGGYIRYQALKSESGEAVVWNGKPVYEKKYMLYIKNDSIVCPNAPKKRQKKPTKHRVTSPRKLDFSSV
jgi:hypothetical protein